MNRHARRCSGAAALVLALVAGCAAYESSATAPAASAAPTATAAPAVTTPSPTGWSCTGACLRWRPVLDRLDEHRARAYAAGRPELLRRVYVPGTRVLARDRRMLRAWMLRGATVSGVRLQVLDIHRLPSDGATVRLRVVDRMARATAHLHAGRDRIALPRDLATERVIVLCQGADGWRIAASR